MERTTTTFLAALVATTLTAFCGDDAVEPSTPTTVTVSPASATLTSLGETMQLTATVQDQNGQAMAGTSVAWTTSDPATVLSTLCAFDADSSCPGDVDRDNTRPRKSVVLSFANLAEWEVLTDVDRPPAADEPYRESTTIEQSSTGDKK